MVPMVGKKFGRLLVLQRAGSNPANGNAKWLCQCDCGNRVTVDGYALRSGQTRSCGCLKREISQLSSKKNPAFQKNVGNAKNLTDENGVSYTSRDLTKRNKSGVIGVSYDKNSDSWYAHLMVDYKYVLAKSFKNFNDAVAARKAAEKRYYGQKRKAE
ncbi:AP2 domain-containing protein [Pediococcus siamensis]|uniref:AP2 domain-containing protein n=1 Tax=Pediococcus siamensis TaxID=381829 RepID=UPI00399FAB9E